MLDNNTDNSVPKKIRKTAKRLRNKELKIRFSDEEYTQIQAKAGDKSIAEFMREYCLNAQNYEPIKPIKYPKIDPQLLRILAGSANNLNQIAKYINAQNLRNETIDLLLIYSKLTLIQTILTDIESQLTHSSFSAKTIV